MQSMSWGTLVDPKMDSVLFQKLSHLQHHANLKTGSVSTSLEDYTQCLNTILTGLTETASMLPFLSIG